MAVSGSKPNKVTIDGTTVTVKAGSGIPGTKGDSINIDGGVADTNYAQTTTIDGGDA